MFSEPILLYYIICRNYRRKLRRGRGTRTIFRVKNTDGRQRNRDRDKEKHMQRMKGRKER